MNICFLTKNIDGKGGINRLVKMLIGKLVGTYNITVFSVYSDKYFETEDVPVPVSYMYDHIVYSFRKVFFGMAGKLRAYIKENKIDLVIATEEGLAPICALGLCFTRTKYICWSHSIPYQERVYKFQKLCRYIGAKTAKWYVSLTPKADEYMKKYYHGRHTVVIGNPIDDRLIHNTHYDINSKKIIMVGRLVDEKCYPLAVEIALEVHRIHPDWTWDIYGDGTSRDIIQSKINECGMEGIFNLMGSVSDIYERYDNYAMIVLTSRYEGYPMVLLEAMGRGLPLVSFDVSGAEIMIDDSVNGFLVKQGDIGELADRICELIENAELRQQMSEENTKRRFMFSLSTFTEKWKNLIDE